MDYALVKSLVSNTDGASARLHLANDTVLSFRHWKNHHFELGGVLIVLITSL